MRGSQHSGFAGAILALAALAGVAGALPAAAGAAPGDTYALKPVYRAGEVERYRTVITYQIETPAGQSKREVTIETTETTKDVKPDGAVIVETKVDSAKADLDGSEQSVAGAGEVLTTTYDAAGRMLKQEGSHEPGSAAQMLSIAQAVFAPDHPLKVGEPYKYSSEAATDSGKRRVSGVLTVLGVENKTAAVPVDVLRVNNVSDTVLTGPMGAQTIHADGYWLIALSNAKPVKLEGKITGIKSGDAAVTLSFSRSRLFRSAASAPAAAPAVKK